MNAGTALRFALIVLSGILLFLWLGGEGNGDDDRQKIAYPELATPEKRAPYQYCEIKTDTFRAQLTTRGATLKRFQLLGEKYQKDDQPLDISTTPQPGARTPAEEEDPNVEGEHEFRQQLFFQFRSRTSEGVKEETNPNWNLVYDSVDWTLAEATESRCEFRYQDESAALTKVVETTGRPYELNVTTTIENRAAEARQHAAAIDTVAWWLDEEVQGKMFRVSPYVTDVECVFSEERAVRLRPEDFEPEDFEAPEFARTGKYGWYQPEGTPSFAAVSNAYFSHALVPLDEGRSPSCQLQIEYRRQAGYPPGAFYRARLSYPMKTLEPGESSTYKVLTYIGPKERRVLSHAAGGEHNLLELIDLGFFSAIAKVLVSFLLAVYSVIPNWGVAIIILTICARVILFPLSVPGIRTMIKMRELKPEMDRINEKYGDDVRAKGVAQMELWRKHGMSPFDQIKGCLPQLATMPVWFALYTTLQTAVELYNIPFLWFPDLSEPDEYFLLPLIIGGTFFLQQKIAPFQGGDPAQRKMMMYFMPGMFTVFMLFLPAGLGVYMFTNSLLAIVQQQVVEAHAKRAQAQGQVQVTVTGEPALATQKDSRKKAKRRK